MSHDFAHLARRISSVTTNCLLSAVVLVAGLTFGRQVLRWWADDPAETIGTLSAVDDADGLGDPGQLHVVQFGDRPWSLGRQSIAGDKTAAAAALREVCREVVQQDNLPDVPDSGAVADFLPRLEASEPVEQEPGQWRLYAFDDVLPMVVGTRPRATGDDAASGGDRGVTQRVVVWGMAMPMDGETWTVFTFQPDAATGLASDVLPRCPCPTDAAGRSRCGWPAAGPRWRSRGRRGPSGGPASTIGGSQCTIGRQTVGGSGSGRSGTLGTRPRGRTGADRSTSISAASRPGRARGC